MTSTALVPVERPEGDAAEAAPENSGDGAMRAGAPLDVDQDGKLQPKWGTRADSPGPRGCWALTKAGRHCAAAVMNSGDYCGAHAGVAGVAADPARHSQVGRVRSAEVRRTRADLRLVLGSVRLDTPRGALKAAATLNAERLAASTLDAALDPTVAPERRARLALDILDAVDPQVQLSASVGGEIDVENASLSELLAFAGAHGIEVPAPPQAQ